MNGGKEKIRRALGPWGAGLAVEALAETDSTNTRLKEWARAGKIAPPFLLTADCQTAGRGRLGRRFVSPAGTGLYMSLLVQPPEGAESGLITVLAAVAVCRALEGLTGLPMKIKWVNDIFFRGRKVCGILAERVEQGVIVGIGVNLKTPPGGFPPEAGAAGALDREIDRFQLAGAIAGRFLEALPRLPDPAVIADYRARMPLIGHTIRYTRGGVEKSALAVGVAEDGGLMIREDGEETVLRTGEVTLGSQSLSGLL